VVFTMQDAMLVPCELAGLDVEPYGVDLGATKFDLTLQPLATEAGLWLTLWYRTELFDDATGERFLGHLQQVLEAAVTDPSQRVSCLPLRSAAERAEVAAWNATDASEGPAATVTTLFEAAAARTPARTALISADGTLTYVELDARANQLAHRLRALGVTADVPVGLALDRSADAIVGLLGVLKAGGTYVPIPPDLPDARLAQQLTECGAQVVVTVAAHGDRLPRGVSAVCLDRDADLLAAGPTAAPPAVVTPASLAYVLFTSGSTGVPKGVGVTHANVVHYARAISRVFGDVPGGAPGDGFAAIDGWHFGVVSTLGADLGNTCVFPALCAGGTLHVLAKEVTTDPAAFTAYASAHGLDVLKITPNHLRALTAGRSPAELAAVLPARWLVLGGEALAWELAERLLGAGRGRILNHYGPTETTVGVCTFAVTPAAVAAARAAGAQTVPIGRPLVNTRCAVLDGQRQPVPVGVPGELFIGGAGVTRGYFRRPELTAERFVDLAGEGRVYRTGDRVRWLPDGALEYLGRADGQVKLRGYRVELGDIEHELSSHPDVEQCVVVLSRRDDAPDIAPQPVAYVVWHPVRPGYAAAHATPVSAEQLGQELRAWATARLPEYMVPAAVVVLDRLPLTPNGKVDRVALAARIATAAALDTYVAPRSATEQALAAIWAEVLKPDRIGVHDNFITLGGHSLLAIRVLGKISRRLGVRLSLRTLFDAPTIEALAEVVEMEVKLAALEGISDDKAVRLMATNGEPGTAPA
jgi:amino acid adenylation domain-containing protein